ncbi:MAG: hypothetical protein ACW99Q_25740 [Candidatus Kariarchaeaceae archaeon]|jgi:hypothetical protein
MIGKKVLIGAFLMAMFVGGVPTFGQQPETCNISGSITWDAVTQDIQGNPETIVHYQVAVFSPLADIDVDIPLNMEIVAGIEIPLVDVLVGLPMGTYRFAVKAVDIGGNESAWSEFLDLTISDDIPPGPPIGIRCK